MTFSILGYCDKTDMQGGAITTSSISVGSRCPWVRAGAGAVTSQNITDPRIGNEVLDLLEQGVGVSDAIDKVMRQRPYAEYRQVAAIDSSGNASHFTGSEILGNHSVAEGHHCVAAGNLLSTTAVPLAMVKEYEQSLGYQLAERLLRALEAGIASGGEVGPTHSAALLVAHETSWPLVDLRVDWSDQPVSELRTCWTQYEPQMNDYLTRALNPIAAPAYGVPGDPQ